MSLSVKAPHYHSEPHVVYLSQLLEELRDGMIQVPRFQRPLVWRWDDRRELLRSIRDGIPMGAVMVWRSTGPRLKCFSTLGPHRIPKSPASPQYLLDGVQRLSTLLGALTPVEDIDVESDEFNDADDQPPSENFAVFYDFEADDFIRAEDVNNQDKVILPLDIILNSVGMLRFQRQLVGDDSYIDEILRRCDELAAAFREYKVPIIPIVTDSIEMATRTFQRLNSQGRPMSEAHMIHALSWSEGFSLNASIGELRSSMLTRLGWAAIDEDILLKACKVALGFGIYSKNADEIGASFRKTPTVVSDVGSACCSAIEFLSRCCGISRPDLLPYALQLVLLIDAFRTNTIVPGSEHESKLASWFWATTYGEYFAGMSGDRFERARIDLDFGLSLNAWSLMGLNAFEVKRLSKKFDFRSVRAKAFALTCIPQVACRLR